MRCSRALGLVAQSAARRLHPVELEPPGERQHIAQRIGLWLGMRLGALLLQPPAALPGLALAGAALRHAQDAGGAARPGPPGAAAAAAAAGTAAAGAAEGL